MGTYVTRVGIDDNGRPIDIKLDDSQYPQGSEKAAARIQKWKTDTGFVDQTARFKPEQAAPQKAAPKADDGWEDVNSGWQDVGVSEGVFAPPATAADRVKAGIRGTTRGMIGVAGLVGDTAEAVQNFGRMNAGIAANLAGRPDLMPETVHGSVGTTDWLAGLLGRIGLVTSLNKPYDAMSRAMYTGGTVLGSGGINPVKSLPAAGGAALGAAVSDGPAAPIIGAMLPGMGRAAMSGTKNAMFGTDITQNQARYADLGATPSLGQATNKPWIDALENLSSKFPGGLGPWKKFKENLQADIGANTQTGITAERAGRTIDTGIDSFLGRTRATWNQLDANLANMIPRDSLFTPGNTQAALARLTTADPTVLNTVTPLINPRLRAMAEGLAEDLSANGGNVSYGGLRNLRSRVGTMLDDALVSDINKGELKSLYSAISADLQEVARQTGPAAAAAFYRQNKYWAARQSRIEDVLKKVVDNKDFENVFLAASPKNVDQITKIRGVMRSLEPDERQIVSEAVINRMGRAVPNQQDDVGDLFSTKTFLTNWNKLAPEAKSQLFNATQRENLDKIAKVSNDINESAKVMSNLSGTAGAGAPYAMAGASLYGLAQGNVAPLAASIGAVGLNAVVPRLLTNQKFISWLGKAYTVKPEQVSNHLKSLAVLINQEKDENVKQSMQDFAQALGNE